MEITKGGVKEMTTKKHSFGVFLSVQVEMQYRHPSESPGDDL